MKHKYYLPNSLPERRAWFVNYKEKIVVYGATLGMSVEDIEKAVEWCDNMIAGIDAADAAQQIAKQKVAAQNEAMDTNLALLRPAIRNQKSATGYTEEIGNALGVIGAEIVIDPLTLKTTLQATKVYTGVDLKFALKNCEGGNIYCKRKDESSFTLYKYITHPETVDERPNVTPNVPEVRQYYVVLVIGDEEIGLASDIVTIPV